MGATVLENLSNRKLVVILCVLFAIQVLSFYVGAFITPAPSSYEQFTSIMCHRRNRSQLAVPRHHRISSKDVSKNCEQAIPLTGEHFDTTTFAVQLPLPRDHTELDYSRWMQSLLVILVPEFQYDPLLHTGAGEPHDLKHLNIGFTLFLDVELAVKNKGDKEWQTYAKRSGLRRTIKCYSHDLKHSHRLDCGLLQLFDLQSLYYDYYLINFELRDQDNSNHAPQFARLTDVTGVAIHHNGGFTQIWIALKAVYFILTLCTFFWYCRRLALLNRQTILLERLLIGLGFALTQLNAPVELLNLYFDITFMTFLNDLRQGIFYCVLLSFWIIFVGEHLLDGARKNSRLYNYIKEMLAICVASTSLLIFDLCERGIQAIDLFTTIWESKPIFAMLSIYVAIAASIFYLGFLAYYIYLAYGTISGKQSSLPEMQITKRLKYQGIIFRFKFLLWATVVCAISTFVFYGLSSQKNDHYHDEESVSYSQIELRSAMLITVNAMWNLYVMFLMILYAPSHKGMVNGVDSDQIEFDCLTDDKEEYIENDMKLLQDLATKERFD